MDIAASKNISIEAILTRFGYRPTRHDASEFWYVSPFAAGAEPSFHVNRQRNVWYDFGLGEGGDPLDLICKLARVSKKEGLRLLAAQFSDLKNTAPAEPPGTFSLQGNEPLPPATIAFKLLEIKDLSNPALIKYLSNDRLLRTQTCRRFLKEVHFENPQTRRRYFAAGMPNRAGGWEIRNPFFKSAIGGKDFSWISAAAGQGGAGEPPPRTISIFEGMMDFLSACEFYGTAVLLAGDVLVLHSMAFVEEVLPMLEAENFAQIFTYFDNDAAGDAATQTLRLRFPKTVEPCNGLFFPCKDFNEWWVRKNR